MKIAICTPHHGDVKAGFAKCLAELVGYSLSQGISVGLHFDGAGPLDFKRNNLAAAAKGADYILWIDADQTFPLDGLARLLSADLPIIGCNYHNRRQAGGTGFALDGTKLKRGQGIENVGALGFGFMLTRTDVFDKIPKPWFASHYDGDRYVSEDVRFCNLARQAGIPIACDHDLEIGHIAECILTLGEITHADTVLPSAGAG